MTVIKIINGHKTELHLCKNCAKKFEDASDPDPAYENIFAPLGEYENLPRNKICPACKTTLKQFLETGYLGCEQCYREFEDEIEEVLKKVQGATLHVGKMPKGRDRNDRQELLEYERLSQELKRAILDERFEDAGVIKQKLKRLLK